MVEESSFESKWDGRQKFFSLWELDEKKIAFYIERDEFRSAFSVMMMGITRIPGSVRNKSLGDIEALDREFMGLIERLEELESLNGGVFEREALGVRRKLVLAFMRLRSKVTDALQDSKLLLPIERGGVGQDDLEGLGKVLSREF